MKIKAFVDIIIYYNCDLNFNMIMIMIIIIIIFINYSDVSLLCVEEWKTKI